MLSCDVLVVVPRKGGKHHLEPGETIGISCADFLTAVSKTSHVEVAFLRSVQ